MDDLKRLYSDSSSSEGEDDNKQSTKSRPSESSKEHHHTSTGRRERSPRQRPSDHSRSRYHESNRSKRRSRSRSHERSSRSHDHDRSPHSHHQRRPRSPPRRRKYHSPEDHYQKTSSSSSRFHDNSSRRRGSAKDGDDDTPPLNQQPATEGTCTIAGTKEDPGGPLQGTAGGVVVTSKPSTSPAVLSPPITHPVGGVTPPVLPGGLQAPTTQTSSPLTTEQQIEAAVAAAQVLARTSSSLPAYINPNAMNPSKFQTLQEKKKKLWSAKKKADTPSHNQWEKVSFGGQGQEAQSKFRRLMGISKEKAVSQPVPESQDSAGEEHAKRLSTLEEQYESSRYLTHIARGAGLGYGTTPITPPVLPTQAAAAASATGKTTDTSKQ